MGFPRNNGRKAESGVKYGGRRRGEETNDLAPHVYEMEKGLKTFKLKKREAKAEFGLLPPDNIADQACAVEPPASDKTITGFRRAEIRHKSKRIYNCPMKSQLSANKIRLFDNMD